MKKKLLIAPAVLLLSSISDVFSQDTVRRVLQPEYDPHYNKIIPDKILEIGLPLLVLFLLSNMVVNIFKIRAENRLKEKALDRQLSESALISLFSEDNTLAKYTYVKYFLILAALGVSFITIHLLASHNALYVGYMAVGMIAINISVAFLIYFFIIRKK
jgi:hypothetical protein